MHEPPQLYSFGDVVRWVIEELGALCPSEARLAAYHDNRQAAEYHDVRYHVEQARCPICRAELQMLARQG